MLKTISITNLAIINKLEVEWTKGLNILTGETGAGKSILFDALSIVLGAKVSPNQISDGKDKAIIEAVFEPSSQVMAWQKQHDLIDQDSTDLVVYREIARSGSRARINGMPVNASILNELRQLLLTFHAQHELRTLLSHSAQLELLDGLGSKSYRQLRDKVRTLYARYRDLRKLFDELTMSEEERSRRVDFARFQLDELLQANLTGDNEDEELGDRHKVLANAQHLESTIDKVMTLLAGGDTAYGEEIQPARDLLQEGLAELDGLLELDATLANSASFLRESLVNLEESLDGVRRYKSSLDLDPHSLQELDERLNVLVQIKRKYGPTLSQAILRRDELADEIEKLDNASQSIDSITSELQQLEDDLRSTSERLTKDRKSLAESLTKSILKELSDLGMERCRFSINFTEMEELSSDGLDRIEFLIAPNPGQPLAPLSKIASGGELSRIMLALKTIFARADSVSTVVFDEIDTGLSGRILKAIRDKLVNLAKSHQILCITHQPIIASVADNYIQVCKEQSDDKTVIRASRLTGESQLRALAVMASGRDSEEVSLTFANSLMEEALRVKGSMY
ncbi:MAG: DNA repair protein RecN [Candidatus Obscuribacterales bacterium]|nr:DNA repair protein RecN [Candidatus Obscuribacterales bacterium]